MNTPLRCGRLGPHEPHDWTRARLASRPAVVYHCRGHVVTEGYLAEYARVADKRDDESAEFTAWVREGFGGDAA